MKKIFNIVFLIIVAGLAFIYRDQIKSIGMRSFNYYFPCQTPITYSLGTFDTKFGISKADFLIAMKDAEAIWEKPIGKDLFTYSLTGNLKINLIYDIRQDSTVQLRSMGLVVQNNKSSYDALKAKYDSLNTSYKQDKMNYDALISSFQIHKNNYEVEVTSINRNGGTNKETISRLDTERNSLDQEIASINQLQSNLNYEVDNINALVVALNQLAKELNIKVDAFNSIGSSLGKEFNEGVYKTGPDGQKIDIYQFDNRTKLVRVLAHELGHALGLDHVDDPKAIMYRLNNGINEKLTNTDLLELKTLCGI